MRKGEQIHFNDPAEIELWCAALEVSEQELLAAVSAVGNRSARVVTYLLDHGSIKGRTLAEALAALRTEETSARD